MYGSGAEGGVYLGLNGCSRAGVLRIPRGHVPSAADVAVAINGVVVAEKEGDWGAIVAEASRELAGGLGRGLAVGSP